MKIAIVRQRYNPYGGAERFVERALSALSAEGAEVSLITRSWAGAPAEGFRQITCDPAYSRLLGGRAARDRSFAVAAADLMAQGAYDITQSHERIPGCMIFRAGDGVHAAWLAHRARTLGPLARLGQQCSGYHRYVLTAEARMFAHPALQAVICNSQMVADEIHRFYGVDRQKLVLIYNGVDHAHFHPGLAAQHRDATRQAAGIPSDVPLLLYVGSGFERKGVPRLLMAMARAATPFHLAVVGQDRKMRAMQVMAERLGLSHRVHFTGPLKDVRPWYGAADAFVLPTLYDPGPNAALEAMACGLPTLTTTSCGAQDWIRAGENGYVVDPLDLEAMTEALDLLCVLAERADAHLAARGAVAQLGLPEMAERLIALYRTLQGSA